MWTIRSKTPGFQEAFHCPRPLHLPRTVQTNKSTRTVHQQRTQVSHLQILKHLWHPTYSSSFGHRVALTLQSRHLSDFAQTVEDVGGFLLQFLVSMRL